MARDSVQDLIDIMARLRDPDYGCAWDLAQNFESISPHTIEEAYEVADAIESGTMDNIKDELGDLLFQVVFYAQMAKEQGEFTFHDIAQHVGEKMVFRHPHVFGNRQAEGQNFTSEDVARLWEEQKAREGKNTNSKSGLLDSVTRGLPALMRAFKLQKKAAKVGFEWDTAQDILPKLDEELNEFSEAVREDNKDRIEDEFGDLLFVMVNIARRYDIDPETALRQTNNKFERRFRYIEGELHKEGEDIAAAPLSRMEELWQQAKHQERAA